MQAEAYDYPVELFQKRVWRVPRNRPDQTSLAQVVEWIKRAKSPMIIAGGGVHYSEARMPCEPLSSSTGIPVGETMAGKGSLRFDHPLCLGAVGATGTSAANIMAKQADLVIGIGTRYSDFTTASKTQFEHPDVRFININVAEFDAYKHSALPVVGDARATLGELSRALEGFKVAESYNDEAKRLHTAWEDEVDRLYAIKSAESGLPFQGALIGAVNDSGDPDAVMVGAAGSLPGDMHKLWRSRHPKQFHLEYGYSCMGYEIAGGLGVKMADPEREVYVMLGDGSYLMMAQEIITSVQEEQKLTIVLMNNNGYRSIGALSRSLGQEGFGTRYAFPGEEGLPTDDGGYDAVEVLPVDLVANARSLGAHVIECQTYEDVVAALQKAKTIERTTVIYVENDRYLSVPGYESWWDVPIAEVSEYDSVNAAREEWEEMREKERYFL